MLKLGIIGAGTIFQNQIVVLGEQSATYKVVSILDIDKESLIRAEKILTDLGRQKEICLCSSFSQFIACDIDVVLIATPPRTHFSLGLDCLRKGKHVLMEKPAVLSMSELELLYEEAHKNGVILHVAYHAAFSIEIQWFLKHQRLLCDKYNFEEVSNVYCGFYDPYVIHGTTQVGKEKLGGSYIDSGINALSVCDKLIDLQEFSTESSTFQTDKNGIVIASNTLFCDGRTRLCIDTGWIYGLNRKRTILQFRNHDNQLVFDHTNQRIILQRVMSKNEILQSFHSAKEIEPTAQNQVLFEDASVSRLNRQYLGVFTDFANTCMNGSMNQFDSERIHKLLFENS